MRGVQEGEEDRTGLVCKIKMIFFKKIKFLLHLKKQKPCKGTDIIHQFQNSITGTQRKYSPVSKIFMQKYFQYRILHQREPLTVWK